MCFNMEWMKGNRKLGYQLMLLYRHIIYLKLFGTFYSVQSKQTSWLFTYKTCTLKRTKFTILAKFKHASMGCFHYSIQGFSSCFIICT